MLCARGGGGGGGCFFFELRAYGSPAIMAPYIFGFFALRAHGSPAIMAPYFCCARGAEAEVAFF